MTATREFAASSTRSVLAATEALRRELTGPATSVDHAVRRLESVARRSIDGLEEIEARGFDQAPGRPAAESPPPPPEEVLAVALGQLSVASALGAAQRAVDEREGSAEMTATRGAAPDVTLDQAVRDLRTATTTLAAPARPRERQAFESAGAESVDLDKAAADCRQQVGTTLDALCEKSATVVTQSFSAAQKLAPKQVQDALSALGERLSLGTRGRGLARLAVKALDSALGALIQLVPSPALQRFRELVHDLWERLEHGEVVPSVMAALFEVSVSLRQADEALKLKRLEVLKVQHATSDLAALAAKFGEHTALASGVVTGIVSVSALLGFLNVGIPHLAVITAGAVLLVLGTIVVLGMDFADTEAVLRRVRGVREVLREMTG